MVPFARTTLGEEEIQAIKETINSGWVVQGKKTEELEQKFADYVGAKHAVFVNSGTSALFLCLQYLKTKKDLKSVTVPSFTFTATAEVVVNSGLDLKFGDIDDDLCIKTEDENVIAVHLGGRRAKQEAMIYDSAHRIEKDDVKGSNALWCYSFYATKNMTTVQGGMIATNDTDASNWLKMARDHGLNLTTAQRYSGKYKQYSIDFVGWRMKSDDLSASVGLEQLKKLPENTIKRNSIVERYNEAFGLKNEGNHLYIIAVQDQEQFLNYMVDKGVQCAVNYMPLHLMKGYKDIVGEVSLPKTEWWGNHCISLPLFPIMTDEEVEKVIKEVLESNLLIK